MTKSTHAKKLRRWVAEYRAQSERRARGAYWTTDDLPYTIARPSLDACMAVLRMALVALAAYEVFAIVCHVP